MTVVADRSIVQPVGRRGSSIAPARWRRQRSTEAPASHAVALVAFDEIAQTIVEPTTDRGAVAAAIRRDRRPVSPARAIAAALARAAEVLGPQDRSGGRRDRPPAGGWQGPPRGGLADDVEVSVAARWRRRCGTSPSSPARATGGRRRGCCSQLRPRAAHGAVACCRSRARKRRVRRVSIPAQSAAPSRVRCRGAASRRCGGDRRSTRAACRRRHPISGAGSRPADARARARRRPARRSVAASTSSGRSKRRTPGGPSK